MDKINKYEIPEPYCYEINVFDEYMSENDIDKEVWKIFLIVTDHIPNKIIEAQMLGEESKDYTNILKLRKTAREQINTI